MNRWKMLSTSQIRAFLSEEERVNDLSLFTVLKRMKKANELYSLRIGSHYLNFHYFWKERWNLLEKTRKESRLKTLNTCGLLHHLQLAELFLEWKREFPHLEALPNVSNSRNVSTKSVSGKHSVPDLVLKLSPSASIYLEYERTLKSESRYRWKWGAYENDESVKTCLYWLDEASHLPALEQLAEKFFDRSIGREDFRLGFLTTETFHNYQFQSVIRLHSLEGTLESTLRALIPSDLKTALEPSQQKNFSPPTTRDDFAISALRANSSPPTSSNDWVLKDGREELARRAP